MRIKMEKIKENFYILNILLFMAKITLFIISKNIGMLISSIYNLCIGITKKNVYSKNNNKYRFIGIMLIVSSISFMIYSIYVIIEHKIFNYDLYTGIFIATITFFDIGIAIYGIIKYKNTKDIQNKVLKMINLATALISLQLTQTALLSFTMEGIDNSFYNGLSGIIFGICSFIIGLSIRKVKK